MNKRKFFEAMGVGLLIAIATTASTASVQAEQKTQLAIVVAKGSPVSGLSLNELKRLFLGYNVTGPGGTALIGVNQAQDSPDRSGFGKAVLKMSQDELSRYWIDRKIRGQSGPPKTLSSPDQVRNAIAHNPAAVGYVRVKDLGADVKAIPIDGKDLKSAGYPVEY